MKLVIVVPCYNEEEVLAETTRQLSSVVDELLSDGKIDEGKILYVDDGSRDRTWELIRGFSETHPSVTGLKLAHNVGHQQALWAGLEWAASHADAAVSIDADLQDDVRSIVGMVDAWRGGADIVYGVRRERTTDTFFKKNTAQAFYKLMNALGGDIVYNHADFRLMSRRTLQALMAYPERNLFCAGWCRLWAILRHGCITTVRSVWPASRNILSARCSVLRWTASRLFPSARCVIFPCSACCSSSFLW